MTDHHDPYAAPAARVIEPMSSDLRIAGRCLVARRDANLPPICIITAEPQRAPGTTRTKKLYWHASWVYLLILVNILVFAVVGLILRRSARITYSISPAARRERNRRTWISVGVFLGGIVLLLAGANTDQAALMLVGPLASLAGLLLLGLWCRVVWAERIEGDFVHLRGISDPAMRAMIAATVNTRDDDWRLAGWPGRQEPTL
jgi:hypothetical protein